MSINVLALSSKRIDSSSLLFSVKAKQKTKAYLELARAECFNSEFPGHYGSPMLCYFTAALNFLVKLGHYHVKNAFFETVSVQESHDSSWYFLRSRFILLGDWLRKEKLP